jgi:UDPglucose 6-dehydrogenase
MRISVLGTGYLGAVHAACMAHLGHEVCAYDTGASTIAMLSAGTSPFYEPGFTDLLTAVLATGRRRLTNDAH